MPGTNYVGKAGDLVVMSEFLLRGFNVAMPEVDVGDDVFVVDDREGTLDRIQVKTATGVRRVNGVSGKFSVSLEQLAKAKRPDLNYVFALRQGVGQWEFLVISREKLRRQVRRHGVGKVSGDNLILYFSFQEAEVICSQRNFQQYRNNWDRWPVIHS